MSKAILFGMKPLTAADLHAYRHGHVQTSRPYAFEVDPNGILWEGTSDALYWHDTRTAAAGVLPLHALRGLTVLSVLCFRDQVVITHADCKHYTVYDPVTRSTERFGIPGEKPIVWYGSHAAGKLIMFDRHVPDGGALILDKPGGPLRKVKNPFGNWEMASGGEMQDGRMAITIREDTLKLLFFDPREERFTEVVESPYKDVSISGRFDHDGVLYLADSSRGQLLAYDLRGKRWLDPIPTPDHGKVYGYIGGGFALHGIGYFTLSTYRFQSRLDTTTGKIIVPEGWNIGTDGHPPRFIDRFLAFDPREREFAYLTFPKQDDGYPLICYSHCDGKNAYITGYMIPFGKGNAPSDKPGDWIVWQSHKAIDQPYRADGVYESNREKAIRDWSQSFGAERSIYLATHEVVPPTNNMEGSQTDFNVGMHQEIMRRVEATDDKAYWRGIAESLSQTCADDRARMLAAGGYVKQNVYYNPNGVYYGSPIATLAGGHGRCGQGVAVALAILEAMGLKARARNLPNHVIAEVFYDNDWHYLDPLIFGSRQPEKDGKIPSVDEVAADPLFTDAMAQDCFVYEPSQLRSRDGFYELGYVFGEWGSFPFYSCYFGPHSQWEFPPTLPHTLPGQRVDDKHVKLRWTPSIRAGGGRVEYRVRIHDDRVMSHLVHEATTDQPEYVFAPEQNVLYYYTVKAMDDHRTKNPNTWYPERRGNFVLAPRGQYGWYGLI